MGYLDVMSMPIKRFYDLLKFKIELDEEKQKQILERLAEGKK